MSLFALSQKNRATTNIIPMDVTPSPDQSTFGGSSCVIRNDRNNAIHNENVEFLRQQSEADILTEQQKLLETMGLYKIDIQCKLSNCSNPICIFADPSIVSFLRQKRKAKLELIPENKAASVVQASTSDIKPSSSSTSAISELDILQHDDIKKWLHFDVVETAKLEWMRDLPANMPELKPGESYEARYVKQISTVNYDPIEINYRFDWKGVLLPFNLEKEESASTDLFLHGDDAHRPGYTLQELFRLAR